MNELEFYKELCFLQFDIMNKYADITYKMAKYIEQGQAEEKIMDFDDAKSEKSCETCVYNVEYSPPHTCDVCTSLDEEEYCMWTSKYNEDGE